VTQCDPATGETLQVRTVNVTEGFTVTTGLVTDAVARVAVEYDGSSMDLDLAETRSEGLRAWASPILAEGVDAIVAYDDTDEEVARTAPDDPTSPPFPADTEPDEGDGQGDPVVLTDVDLGRHGTYGRVVVEVADGGHAGWRAEYVDEAIEQGSGQTIDFEGDAILRLTLSNMNFPTGSELDQVEPGPQNWCPVTLIDPWRVDPLHRRSRVGTSRDPVKPRDAPEVSSLHRTAPVGTVPSGVVTAGRVPGCGYLAVQKRSGRVDMLVVGLFVPPGHGGPMSRCPGHDRSWRSGRTWRRGVP
jgi:hypothetical protein